MGYLVISRRLNERIEIGDDIEILIADIAEDKIDIAIKAPKELHIKRKATHLEEQKDGATTRNKSRQRHKRD